MAIALVYEADGQLAVVYLPPELTISIEEVAAKFVPAGTPWRTVDSLPAGGAEAWVANFDDQPCVVSIDETRLSALTSASPLEQIETWFSSAISEGFGYGEDIRLGLTTEDVALLTGNYVLAKEAAALGLPLPPIIGMGGTVHTFDDINDMTALMLAYGQHRAALSAKYAADKAALEN